MSMAAAIGSIGSIGASVGTDAATSAGSAAGPNFGDLLGKGLDSVSSLQSNADALASSFAAGGNVQIADLMAATSKANLGMTITNEIRNRALEAYQSIINIQV
jgi:flagellar hook-basal body complex protein FliE